MEVPRVLKRSKIGDGDKSREDGKKTVMTDYSARLPEEMLDQIFSSLTDSKDLLSVSQASTKFSRIVGSTKPSWLFEQVFPLIFSELERSDILNCRAVCKSWKAGVDKHLQTQPHIRAMEPYKADGEGSRGTGRDHALSFQYNICRKHFICLALHDLDAISRFTDFAGTHQGNPFVLRSVSFDDEGARADDQQDMYWASVFSLLTLYGHYIWHLYIHVSRDPFRQHRGRYCYNMLRICLSSMPSLKTLSVCGFSPFQRISTNATGRNSSPLAKYIQKNPLPDLPSLEWMDIELLNNPENRAVSNELLRKYLSQTSTSISRLSLWDLWKLLPTTNSALRNVTCLELFVDTSVYKWSVFCYHLNAPKLARLLLSVEPNLDVGVLLKSLAHMASLNYLTLRFNRKPKATDGYNVDGDQQKVVSVPQVKTLEVVDSPHVPYSRILSHLPKLEYMLVCGTDQEWWKRDRNRVPCQQDNVHFHFHAWMFSQAMSGANIWAYMNHLKELTLGWMGTDYYVLHEIIKRRTYTREMYTRGIQVQNLREREQASSESAEY